MPDFKSFAVQDKRTLPNVVAPVVTTWTRPAGSSPILPSFELEQTLVSVITPAYEAEKYIGKALESVRAQTYRNWEILITVEGESECAARIVTEFAAQVPQRVSLFRHPQPSGPSAARNVAMRAASGGYIAFLDADDYWMPDHLATLCALLDSGAVDLAYAEAIVFRETLSGDIQYLPLDTIPVADPSTDLFRRNFINPSGAAITRSLMESVGEFSTEVRQAQDLDYWIRAAARGFRIQTTKKRTYYYRKSPGSYSSNSAKESLGIASVIERNRYCGLQPQKALAGMASNHYFHAGQLHWRANPAAASRAFFKSWLLAKNRLLALLCSLATAGLRIAKAHRITKPIWFWERMRRYPVRTLAASLPHLAAKEGTRRFTVLATPKSFDDALWAAWSWYRYLQHHEFELQIAVDGDLPGATKDRAQKLFPGISIYDAAPVVARLSQRQPELTQFLQRHPLGRKLGLVLALSQQTPLLYSDHDVLAFDAPEELLSNVRDDRPCYLLEERDGTRDEFIAEHARAIGVEYLPRFNSGLLYVPKSALSAQLAADLLKAWRPPVRSWYTEQTVLSVLMHQCHAVPLPEARYVVSNRRQFYWEKDVDYRKIVARHFTGPVRHVMYGYGFPELLRQSRFRTCEPTAGQRGKSFTS